MFAVCPQCGEFSQEKQIDPVQSTAVCPACDHAHSFRLLPLFLLSGASGTGKSTVCLELIRHDMPPPHDFIVLDSDILWTEEFHAPAQWPKYTELWLRMCKNLNQSGRPVLLAGAGFGVPDNIRPRMEARYFSAIHTLALVCAEDVLAERLRARPDWRQSGHPKALAEQLRFNRWFQENAAAQTPPITLLDTTHRSAADTAVHVTDWVHRTLNAPEQQITRD